MSSSSSSNNHNTVHKYEKQKKEEEDDGDEECIDDHNQSNESTSLLKNQYNNHSYYCDDDNRNGYHGYDENEEVRGDEESIVESTVSILQQDQINIPSSTSITTTGSSCTCKSNSIHSMYQNNMEQNEDNLVMEEHFISDRKDHRNEQNFSHEESGTQNKEQQPDDQNDDEEDGAGEKVTYFSVVRHNRPFQLYLLSYIITQAGEWFTYVASIELMEKILNSHHSDVEGEEIISTSQTSRRYISYLVIFRLLPFLIISPFGGVLADMRDRRHSMIILDFIASALPLLFLLSVQFNVISIPIIFAITALQSTVAAFYEPCRNAIIPLLVPYDEEMKMATTLSGLAWSVMTAVGSALGGIMVAHVGIETCFGTYTNFVVSLISTCELRFVNSWIYICFM